jgi:microcystin-dependent protein
MSEPFLGQISPFGFNFAPKGWALCNGQLLPISQNQALFSLLGTMYGGNGQTTFALPNLQGSVALGIGSAFNQGTAGGQAAHTLVVSETPAHTHAVSVSATAGQALTASNNFPAASSGYAYATGTPNTTLGAGTSSAGSSQPHNNMAPYLTINYCIALQGIFPARS